MTAPAHPLQAFIKADRFVTLVAGGGPQLAARPPTRPATLPDQEQAGKQQVVELNMS
jgi:hypothetical protein